MTYKLYTDGSYKQGLELAAIGGYLLDSQNNEVFNFSEMLDDIRSFDSHEIFAMKTGLQKCIDLGIKDISCFSDDKELCNMLSIKDQEKIKKYTNRNPKLDNLVNMFSNFDNINFTYIPREENKKADRLANNALKHLLTNKHFESKNILNKEKYNDSTKKEFLKIKESTENYFVFIIDKQDGGYIIKTHKCSKNNKTKEINSSFIHEKIILSNNWLENSINHLTEALGKIEIKSENTGFMFSGDSWVMIDSILRGEKKLTHKLLNALDLLDETAKEFKSLILHESRDIVEHVLYKDEVNRPRIENEKEFFFNALKLLGENYKIGSNQEIEKYAGLTGVKKNSVEELQKKYFGKFVTLGFLELSKSDVKPKDIGLFKQQQIALMRQDLENKGVKFRY